MQKQLTGTEENFMHAHYLAARVCDLVSDTESDLNAEFGGEDGLVTELMPYGLTLGKVIDAIYEEKKDFPGVPAYDISETVAGDWMHKYLEEHTKMPNMEVWENFCTNMVRAWCQRDIKEFEALNYKQQIFVDSGKIGIVKLLSTPEKQEPPRTYNGEAISVENVKKFASDAGLSVNRVTDMLQQMPRGTQFVNLDGNDYPFWRRVEGSLVAYVVKEGDGMDFWYQPPHKPTNLVEYQKFIDIHYDSPEQKQARVEQELNMILDGAEELFDQQVKPDTDKKSEPSITDSSFGIQLEGLDISGSGNVININFKQLEIQIIDGKITDVKHPMFNV